MIDAKQKEIQAIEKDNPALFQQFSADIRKLDSTYQVLRNTLPANPNKEQLLEAMISNLQMQIDVLNQQLRIIQQVRQPKSSNT
jgi:phage shock protein A